MSWQVYAAHGAVQPWSPTSLPWLSDCEVANQYPVMTDSQGLVDFVVVLVDSILHLPIGQVEKLSGVKLETIQITD